MPFCDATAAGESLITIGSPGGPGVGPSHIKEHAFHTLRGCDLPHRSVFTIGQFVVASVLIRPLPLATRWNAGDAATSEVARAAMTLGVAGAAIAVGTTGVGGTTSACPRLGDAAAGLGLGEAVGGLAAGSLVSGWSSSSETGMMTPIGRLARRCAGAPFCTVKLFRRLFPLGAAIVLLPRTRLRLALPPVRTAVCYPVGSLAP